jgi:aminopeptidase N
MANITDSTTAKPQMVYLADYETPPYRVEFADLTFTLNPTRTRVRAKLKIVQTGSLELSPPLELDGENLDLIEIAIDGRRLSQNEFTLTGRFLAVPSPPKVFTLETEVEISPHNNKALEGLYRSNNVYCTQCEPEGFRRITYFIDRPDVMAVFRTTIIAPKDEYPILLSNGNLIVSGDLEGGMHYATWHDPFPKPSYLFALVAGNLASIKSGFKTRSGRDIELCIYVENGNEARAQYAMEALKRAIRWDEETYDREYDLEVFNIVAVSDFNMGAMENKGLNIFNDRFILADPETATDTDYYLIESIIAHEYFHNWSGNRITCRDWFQLSLKEGLTVFRDQEFTADMRNRANKRIDDVNVLRISQFREDAGPFAHPVRPDQYMEINNFYTSTVYQKGAEVIRMMQTILGEENFREGMDLYFSRHDGQAVTCDDFVLVMEEASGVDLEQFKLWYSQAGTPHIKVDGVFDPMSSTYTLTLRQSCNSTPGQSDKKPFHIPIALGLIDESGEDVPLHNCHGETTNTVVLELRNPVDTYIFTDIKSEYPHLSINRNFSAPITIAQVQTPSDQIFLMGHDSDPFNRWAACQEYSTNVILGFLERIADSHEVALEPAFLTALQAIAVDANLENAFRASLLELPSEGYISTRMAQEDPINLSEARKFTQKLIATKKRDIFQQLYDQLKEEFPYVPDAAGMGWRMLKNVSLTYLAALETSEVTELVKTRFDNASNMTEKMDALEILNKTDTSQRSQALNDLYGQFKNNHLVINKWLSIQACAPLPGVLTAVKQLLRHSSFDLRNPNKVRAVMGSFASFNPVNFHAVDGSGYVFLSDQVLEIDAFNPQLAARLVPPLGRWKRFSARRQGQMKGQLERIAASPSISGNVYEMVKKSLDS